MARAAIFLGAIFPDSDVILNLFEPNGLGTIRFHRGPTHSLVCMPVFAALLASMVGWLCRWRRIECPSWVRLSVFIGAGIGLHIVFDAITSFGTMVWSPLSWSRVSWDTTFILDPVLTLILLLPLLLGWIYSRREKAAWRGVALWFGLSALAAVVVRIESAFEIVAAAPVSEMADLGDVIRLNASLPASAVVCALLASVLGLPALRGKGFKLSRRRWCSLGALAAIFYLGLNAGAHALALRQVEDFARSRGLHVQDAAALPMPPSLLYWSGLIRTPEAMYHSYFSLFRSQPPRFETIARRPLDPASEAALQAPNAQAMLRFSRFPLVADLPRGTSYHRIMIFDLRFLPSRDGTLAFAYQITLDADGHIVHQGWLKPEM